jgi:hypothetical protein
MSPPPAPALGDQQSEIVYLLKTLLPQGRRDRVPLSTSDVVKAIDVAWLVPERRQEVRSVSCGKTPLFTDVLQLRSRAEGGVDDWKFSFSQRIDRE